MRYRNTTIWKEAPFVRLIIPFTIGIVIERYLQLSFQSWLPAVLLLIITWLALSRLPIHTRYNFRWVYGLLLNGALLISGGLLALLKDTTLSTSSLSLQYKKGDALILILDEPLSATRATYKTIAIVSHLARSDSCIKVSGKIILYFRKDSATAALEYGKKLLVVAAATPVINSGNPGSFDFAAYARLQGITMQAFVASDDYQVIADEKGSSLKAWLLACRKVLCTILKKYIPGVKEAGLAEALLVGYKEDLDKELLRVYSNTGVVHVIAISGLHLGILYIMCKGLLVLLPFFRNRKWLTSVLIIVFLWLFSLLTGGSPSVLRSAVMFTAILCGESFAKKISIYNCLAASAFILLVYRPYWLFDIGFQLSYSAVLSILIFNKPIDQLLYVKNKSLEKVWQMTAVTLSAQLLTTPVSLFYFHQFPNYFLLANLVAVPLSSAVLIGTIFLCLISFLPVVPEITGRLLSLSIRIMNDAVAHINSLPFSVTSGINISLLHSILLYCLIGTITVYLLYKNKLVMYASLLVLLGIASLNLFQQLEIRWREELIVYNIRGKQVIEIINGRKSSITGIHAACIEDECRQIINAAHTSLRIVNSKTVATPFHIKGKKKSVWLLNGNQHLSTSTNGSVVIISSTVSVKPDSMFVQFHPAIVILDAAHTGASIIKWTAACNKHHINVHPVAHKGAFVMTLN